MGYTKKRRTMGNKPKNQKIAEQKNGHLGKKNTKSIYNGTEHKKIKFIILCQGCPENKKKNETKWAKIDKKWRSPPRFFLEKRRRSSSELD